MKYFRRFAALIVLAIAACAPAISRPEASAIDHWLDALRARGAIVETVGEAEQPFISVIGSMVQVNGEDVQLFAYLSEVQMDAQATRISPDGGTVGTAKIHWIGAPHFFKQGSLLVLYVGENGDLLRLLTEILGRQFAGQ